MRHLLQVAQRIVLTAPQGDLLRNATRRDRTSEDGPGQEREVLDFKSVRLPTQVEIGNPKIRKLFSLPTSPGGVCRPEVAMDVISYKRCKVSGLRPRKSEINSKLGQSKTGMGKTGIVKKGTY